MKLSKECIEAIDKIRFVSDKSFPYSESAMYKKGILRGVTDESIYSKAGLISLEGFELLITKMFLQYEADQCIALTKGEKFEPSGWLKNQIQIYQEQKEK